MKKLRVCVAFSGGGRTLANLIEAQPNYDYEIVQAISSNPNCRGIEVARSYALEPIVIAPCQDVNDPIRANEWLGVLKSAKVDLLALGGYLHLVPSLKGWENRIINIHPALLPQYGGKGMYGMHVHRAVKANAETESGATVHYVNSEYDKGDIISAKRVSLSPQDSAEDIATKVFEAECELYPEVLDKLAKERTC